MNSKNNNIIKEFKERYLKTPDGWILDGKNGAEIEAWLDSKLNQVRQESYLIQQKADDKAIDLLKLRIKQLESKLNLLRRQSYE